MTGRSVKVWEQTIPFGTPESSQQQTSGNGSGGSLQSQPSTSRWTERTALTEARGTAAIASDNYLRIYECLEQPPLTNWTLSSELDVQNLPSSHSASVHSRGHTVAIATPTQTNTTLDNASVSLVTQALQQNLQQQQSAAGTPQPQSTARQGVTPGNREADGGWCISWCKERYWGELIAAACGTSGVVKIIQLSPSHRPTAILTLDPAPAPPASSTAFSAEGSSLPSVPEHSTASTSPPAYAITSIAWAPSCGRSYHLIATGGRDGRVRIWRVKPGEDFDKDDEDRENEQEEEDGRWTASVVADFDQHNTVLSSTGNDGRVRLWKATSGSVWRPAGSIGVEQTEEADAQEGKDIDMET
ncbi:hypothetical protein H0H92_011007 [Tricholoma furcatifolium]|nr:hypothetical protein H0H92_011007 [Tricholoma furcatifolium]